MTKFLSWETNLRCYSLQKQKTNKTPTIQHCFLRNTLNFSPTLTPVPKSSVFHTLFSLPRASMVSPGLTAPAFPLTPTSRANLSQLHSLFCAVWSLLHCDTIICLICPFLLLLFFFFFTKLLSCSLWDRVQAQ